MFKGEIHWVKVATSLNELVFNENHLLEIETPLRTICMGIFEGKIFAFANKCPHASGLFVEGYIDAIGNVVCPIHRYKFCMHNGKNVTGEGYFLKNFPVEIKEDGVYVGVQKSLLEFK